MSLFRKKVTSSSLPQPSASDAALAMLALNLIADGVNVIDGTGIIRFSNPAAAVMMGYGRPENVVGRKYTEAAKLWTQDGQQVIIEQSDFGRAVQQNLPFTSRKYILESAVGDHKIAISVTLTPTGGLNDDKLVTFRDITKELAEEEEQSEFISTASHEMRTPVASIEGYLGLALNPATASIDERARQYLTAAHAASQHLGHLFKDLLDVTKLDDGRLRPRLVPVDVVNVVREMSGARLPEMQAKHLKYSFGTADVAMDGRNIVMPSAFAEVDLDFMREILDNLIDNAIKYTPEGGEIWVNARGDGDKVLINVTDTGIGVSPEDAAHLFQKFYRVDNSQTRSIGGTGLGLYLVKQRVEAMGGRVWVESAFGDGSTFFVSLPRLNEGEYERKRLAYQSAQVMQGFREMQAAAQPAQVVQPVAPVAPTGVPTVPMNNVNQPQGGL